MLCSCTLTMRKDLSWFILVLFFYFTKTCHVGQGHVNFVYPVYVQDWTPVKSVCLSLCLFSCLVNHTYPCFHPDKSHSSGNSKYNVLLNSGGKCVGGCRLYLSSWIFCALIKSMWTFSMWIITHALWPVHFSTSAPYQLFIISNNSKFISQNNNFASGWNRNRTVQ